MKVVAAAVDVDVDVDVVVVVAVDRNNDVFDVAISAEGILRLSIERSNYCVLQRKEILWWVAIIPCLKVRRFES